MAAAARAQRVSALRHCGKAGGHHLVLRAPVRTSALRGLGALPNVFAIECFMDELAERAGIDPVEYRLSLLSDPRARRLVENIAQRCGWSSRRPAGSGRGLGLGWGAYKNRAAYCAVAVELDVDQEVRLRRIWCAADAGLVINPDGARNQLEGGIVQAASMVLKEQVRMEGEGITSLDWAGYPILGFSEVPEIDTEIIHAPDLPTLGMGECFVRPDGGRNRQRGGACTRGAHSRHAVYARADRGCPVAVAAMTIPPPSITRSHV